MTHEDMERRGIAEEYIRGRLTAQERADFEDHYFACDSCFETVQRLQQLAAGINDAARTGQLPPITHTHWLQPAFYAAAAAAVAMAAGLGWTLLLERPRLEAEIAHYRDAGRAQQRKLAELESKLSARFSSANLPLLMLEATRAQQPPKFAIPADAEQIALWMEPPPAPSDTLYRLEIAGPAGRVIHVIEGARANSYGALAIALPAQPLHPGIYTARLSLSPAGSPLIGDYRFEIVR